MSFRDKPKATTDGNPPSDDLWDAGAPKPINPETGQHGAYWILPEAERAKGFVRPVRRSYRHKKCGTVTTMSQAIAETFARDPSFYGAGFCCACRTHFPNEQFTWEPDGSPVGS